MGIKYNELKNTWKAFICMRHPTTKKPVTIARHSLRSRADALKVEKKLRADLAIKLDRDARTEKEWEWSRLCMSYYEELEKRDISKKTIDNIKLCLQAHTGKIWGSRFISDITPQEIKELIRSNTNHSESHRKNILKYIRGCFAHAVSIRIIKENPTPLMKFGIGEKLDAVLSIEQSRKLLNYAKEFEQEWYPVWAMALYTGLRNGELYALTWDKIDFENRRALIDSGWDNKNGFKDYTKNKRDRFINLAPELIYILRELKIKNSSTSVFVLPRISKWDKCEQSRELKKVLRGLGLPEIRFHDLRATWATIMLNRDVPLVKVKTMGGWKEYKTMDRYIRLSGLDVSGICDELKLHNPSDEVNILSFAKTT